MVKRPKMFPGCPFCCGYLPTVLNRSSRGPRIYYPNRGVACLCGYAETWVYRASLASELALARAREAARAAEWKATK